MIEEFLCTEILCLQMVEGLLEMAYVHNEWKCTGDRGILLSGTRESLSLEVSVYADNM